MGGLSLLINGLLDLKDLLIDFIQVDFRLQVRENTTSFIVAIFSNKLSSKSATGIVFLASKDITHPSRRLREEDNKHGREYSKEALESQRQSELCFTVDERHSIIHPVCRHHSKYVDRKFYAQLWTSQYQKTADLTVDRGLECRMT